MDPISDMLIALKNAQTAQRETVVVFYSKIKAEIISVLEKNGYVKSSVIKGRRGGKIMEITLTYNDDGEGAITDVKRISKLSRRTYVPAKKISRSKRMGLTVITTPKGVMSGEEASRLNVGGEVICRVI